MATGDTAEVVAGKLQALVAANARTPFTSAVVVASVVFTAANGGTLANSWTVFTEGSVAGLSVSVGAWTGGATDPVITNLLDAIGNRRYQTIVWPEVFTDTIIEAFMDARFNANEEILQGVAFITSVDTAANVQAKAAALNSQSMVIIASRAVSSNVLEGSANREFPDVITARVAALRSLRLTNDAALSQFLTTPAPLDQFGSRALSSLPYANTVLPNTPIVRPLDQWTALEQTTFRNNGVSIVGPNRNFSGMLLGEFVTTNTTDEAGNDDESFKFLITIDTVAAVRDSYDVNVRRRYAQSRLTQGDLIPGRDLANQASIEAFTEEVYQSLAEDALVAAGAAALSDFKANGREVILDIPQGKVTINLAPVLVTGLRVVLGTVTVNFGA